MSQNKEVSEKNKETSQSTAVFYTDYSKSNEFNYYASISENAMPIKETSLLTCSLKFSFYYIIQQVMNILHDT